MPMCSAIGPLGNKARVVAVMLLAPMALAGCLANEAATRGASGASPTPGLGAMTTLAAPAAVMAPKYDVVDVQIVVPHHLRVSEANVFLPLADIVWRGDAMGDRYEQVAAIFRNAADLATRGMNQGPKAVVQIEVVKFHCLTEKARYFTGGSHTLHFMMTVRDAATGAVIEGPRLIKADVHASGGARAIAEDEAGRTQKVVVTERLIAALRSELSAPTRDPALMVALPPVQVAPELPAGTPGVLARQSDVVVSLARG